MEDQRRARQHAAEFEKVLDLTGTSQISPTPIEIRTFGSEELKKATECLAQAFASDPCAAWIYGATDLYLGDIRCRKWRVHVSTMRYIIASHLLNGLVKTAGPDFDAVALW
jgi:hypothetical protein